MAWITPSLALIRRKGLNTSLGKEIESSAKHLSGWLVLGNIALLSNLLSSQLIFRLAAVTLSPNIVSEAQVLITVSCFASTLTLALLPQIIANHRRQLLGFDKHVKQAHFVLLTVGLVLPVMVAIFRKTIASTLLPRESTLGFLDALLIATPAFLLVVTLLISGKLIAAEKARLVALLSILGLAGLWGVPSFFGGNSLRSLVMALFFGALVLPLAFLLTQTRFTKLRRRNNDFAT